VHCSRPRLAGSRATRPRHHVVAARADFSVIAYVPVAVSDDRAQARASVRRSSHAISACSTASPSWRTQAWTARGPSRSATALMAGRAAADLVTDELVDTFAVAGTPAECRAALARWAEAGLDAVVAVVPDTTDIGAQLERMGRELAPAWKELRCR